MSPVKLMSVCSVFCVVVSVNNVVLHCTVLTALSMYVVRLPVLGCVDCVLVSCCVGKLCCAYSPILCCAWLLIGCSLRAGEVCCAAGLCAHIVCTSCCRRCSSSSCLDLFFLVKTQYQIGSNSISNWFKLNIKLKKIEIEIE